MGQPLQPLEDADLGLQLADGARSGGLIQDLFLGGSNLLIGRVVEILEVFGRKHRPLGHRRDGRPTLQQLQLAQALLQPLAAAAQRLVDCLGRRGKPPLQDGEREADRAGALLVVERFGAIELLADVLRDFLVEARLRVREPVRDSVGEALGEQRRTVELQQLLLHHAPHEIGDVGGVHAIAEAPFEAIAVEKRHEELEIFLLAIVGSGGHQKEVAGQRRQELAELVALGVLDLTAEERGGELVGFVAHDEVPSAIGRLELGLHVLVARQLVEPRDDEVVLHEPVAGARGLELVVGEDVEWELEAPVQLVLPLLGQVARADDEAPLEISADDQLLDEEPGHDRLAGAGIVGKEEA